MILKSAKGGRMYLTKLVLNTKSKYVVSHMADCEWVHKQIMELGFGHIQASQPRGTLKVLYALDGSTIYIQSAVKPEFRNIKNEFIHEPQILQIDKMKEMCLDGSCVRVRCTCNPTYHDDNGKRRFILSEEKRDEWFRNVMIHNGAEVLVLSQTPESTIWGIKKDADGKTHRIYAKSVTYTGALRINDTEKFWNIFSNGIGKAKSYGCGMLMITK